MATYGDLYKQATAQWDALGQDGQLRSLGFMPNYKEQGAGFGYDIPEQYYGNFNTGGDGSNDAALAAGIAKSTQFDKQKWLNDQGIVQYFDGAPGTGVTPEQQQAWRDNWARSFNQFGFNFRGMDDYLLHQTGPGHFEQDPTLGKLWVPDNKNFQTWNNGAMAASGAPQGGAIAKAVGNGMNSGALVKAIGGAIGGAGLSDLWSGVTGGGLPGADLPTGMDLAGDGGINNVGNYTSPGATLPSSPVTAGPSVTPDPGSTLPGSTNPTGTGYEGLPYNGSNIPTGVEQTAAQSAEQLGSLNPLTQQGGWMQSLADMGVPTSTLQNLPSTAIQQLSKLSAAELQKVGAAIIGGGAAAGSGGGAGGGTGGIDLSKIFNTADGSIDWAKLATMAGGIADKVTKYDPYDLAKKTAEDLQSRIGAGYTAFDPSMLSQPKYQNYIKSLTDPAIGRINEQTAQAKNAAQARAAMSGQDITAYGATPGQPDIQQQLIDRTGLDSVGKVTADATKGAFDAAMGEHQKEFTLPLTADQQASTFLYANKALGAPDWSSFLAGLSGAAGTTTPGGITPPTTGTGLPIPGTTTTPATGTGTGLPPATLPGTVPQTGSTGTGLPTNGDDNGNVMLPTNDDNGNPMPPVPAATLPNYGVPDLVTDFGYDGA